MSEDMGEQPEVHVEEEPATPVPVVVPTFSMLVNSVALTSQVMSVTLANGEVTKAAVPILEVELVDETGQHGSRTMRYISQAERDYATSQYVQGEMVTVSA